MCEQACNYFDTFNPEVEFQKFLKRKPLVQTVQLYEQLDTRETIKSPNNFTGYGLETTNNKMMYRTYNSEYGYYTPNIFTISSRHYPLSQKFSNELHRCGMYRNFSLNTNVDKTYY